MPVVTFGDNGVPVYCLVWETFVSFDFKLSHLAKLVVRF